MMTFPRKLAILADFLQSSLTNTLHDAYDQAYTGQYGKPVSDSSKHNQGSAAVGCAGKASSPLTIHQICNETRTPENRETDTNENPAPTEPYLGNPRPLTSNGVRFS